MAFVGVVVRLTDGELSGCQYRINNDAAEVVDQKPPGFDGTVVGSNLTAGFTCAAPDVCEGNPFHLGIRAVGFVVPVAREPVTVAVGQEPFCACAPGAHFSPNATQWIWSPESGDRSAIPGREPAF